MGHLAWLEYIARRIESVIYPICRVSNRAAEAILAMMMILITVDVILRNLANSPLEGSYELVEFMLLSIHLSGENPSYAFSLSLVNRPERLVCLMVQTGVSQSLY